MAEQEAGSVRDRIRSATLGSKKQFRTEKVEINGETVTVKQPSQGERKDIINAVRDSNGNIDTLEMLVWSIIKLVYVPDANERVFDDSDYDNLMNEPTGGWVDQLGERVGEIMNVEEAEGNG